MCLEFDGKWKTKCLVTTFHRLPLLTLLYASAIVICMIVIYIYI